MPANQTQGSHYPTMKDRLEDEGDQNLVVLGDPKEVDCLQQLPVG